MSLALAEDSAVIPALDSKAEPASRLTMRLHYCTLGQLELASDRIVAKDDGRERTPMTIDDRRM